MKEITSQQNPLVKKWKKLQKKKYREKELQYIVEGPHLVQEALKQEQCVTSLIFHPDFHAPESWTSINHEQYIVSAPIFNHISQTETPQGVLAICNIPKQLHRFGTGRFLLLDSIQDPGNLGTIIRTADAVGMTAIYLGDGCVDLYNQKVLRSAQGSHFHLPIVKEDLSTLISKMKKNNIDIYGTDLKGQLITNVKENSSSYAILIGNEGQGVNQKLLGLTDMNLKIPIYGQAESLNVAVAASILMYWFRR